MEKAQESGSCVDCGKPAIFRIMGEWTCSPCYDEFFAWWYEQ